MAPELARAMHRIADKLKACNTNHTKLIAEANSELQKVGFKPDDIFICDADSLQPVSHGVKRAVVLMAAVLGPVRLIDNIEVDMCT